MISGMFDSGALPVLERVTQFTGARHKVLADNIANLDTPYFRPKDLSVREFQVELAKAVEQRRRSPSPTGGTLRMGNTRQLRFTDDNLQANPQAADDGILFHDRNNRDLERLMQGLAENTMAFNAANDLLRHEFGMLSMAIRGRV
ncbi:MAG: flagellar basal body rod protein FlgB [Phycisphaeraceae bacterium]|nr:flagellar basal body rod protein FlgB [Phycisphaeraceae bacterium]